MRYEEIKLSDDHRHYLKPEDSKVLFNCDGCMEDGIGLSYRCDRCNFDLHYHCAKKSKKIVHPLYRNYSFEFMDVKKKRPKRRPRCKACGEKVKGFFYCCKANGVKLHPCCAKLPDKLDDKKKKLSLSTKKTKSCLKCEKERSCWSYMSSDEKYTLHVPCAREMLMERWRNGDGKDRLQAPHKMSKSEKKKKWKILLLPLRFIISALIGDPTILIAGILDPFMPRA